MSKLSFFVLLWVLVARVVISAASPLPQVIFFEDFEAEQALDKWDIQSTHQGRVRIAPDPRDPENRGILMDDGVNDVIFSQNIARTSVSIAGYSNIRISAEVYSLNNHVYTVVGFAGLVVRAGDLMRTYSINWHVEQFFDIALDSALARAAAAGDQIITIELHQYGNFSVPHNGLFFDNVMVTGTPARGIYVVSPLVSLKSVPLEILVLVDPVPEDDVELTLMRFGIPHGTATYPAGEMMAALTFPDFANNRLDGDQFHQFALTDGFYSSMSFSVLIQDDTPAGLEVEIPENIREGESGIGQISVSIERGSTIAIELESSNPSILSVPATVSLSRYASSVTFPITTYEDPRILTDREVTVTARVGGDVVSRSVLLTERNTLVPTVSGPEELSEGDVDVEFTLFLEGIADAAVTVTLNPSPADVSVNPASITLQPGEREASFFLSVAEESIRWGDSPFTITATTLETGEQDVFMGTILDNRIAGFDILDPQMIEADRNLDLGIRAVNVDGRTVSAFNGRASLYRKDSSSGAEELVEEVSFAQGEATASPAFPFSARGDFLVLRSEDDSVETISGPLSIFAKLAFAANDIVYDSVRERLYTVSGGTASPGHLHTVTAIYPDAAEIGEALFIGGDPRNLIITDNSEYLYTGMWSAYAVQRVDLKTFTVAERIILNSSSSYTGDSFTAVGLLAIPGRPLDFIASQSHTGSTYHTTRLYINGAVQAQGNGNAVQLAAAGNPNEFYAFNSNSTGYDFMRLRLISTGFETVESHRQFFSGFNTRIAGQGDLIFTNGGRVANGLKMEILADLRFPSEWTSSVSTVMFPDLDRSRVYYANGNQIVAYDTGIFQLVAKITLPNIGNITRIIRWGDVGLAALTDAGQVVLLEAKDLIPTGPATDLSVSISAAPDPVFLNEELEYTAKIENIGSEIARDARLVIDLNAGQRLDEVKAGAFLYSTLGRTVTIEFGDMAPGDSHQIAVTAEPLEITTLIGTVGAMTSSQDVDYSNNRTSVVMNVAFVSEPESINVVKIPINDVQFEPVSGDLIVSVRADAHAGIANHILTINPTSGLITRAIPLPSEPGILALSDDGSTVYAVSSNTGYRVDLNTGQIVDTITFSSFIGSDNPVSLVVATGTVDKLVVGFNHCARLYVDGVGKGEAGGSPVRVVRLPDPNRFFAYNSSNTGFDSYMLEMSENGVAIASTADLFQGFATRIKSDGYHVFGTDGRGVRADLMIVEGTFPLSSVFGTISSSTISLAPDRAGQRVYYARNKSIASFDSANYLHIRTGTFNQLPAAIVSLERWGNDGFAARLQNNELAIIRTSLISDAASSIDLLVSIPDHLEVDQTSLTITGQAFSGQGISSVTANGNSAATLNGFQNWSIALDNLVEGENIISITATVFGTPATTRTITRTVHYLPPIDFWPLTDSWRLSHFGFVNASLARPDLDPDGDGFSNLAEFLFGTDPLQPDIPHLTITLLQEEGDLLLVLEFTHRLTSEYQFVIESSSDLSTWHTFDGPLELLEYPIPVDWDPNYVISSYLLQPSEGGSGEFFRIVAEPK